jgi:SAM-dependent methyltransferase
MAKEGCGPFAILDRGAVAFVGIAGFSPYLPFRRAIRAEAPTTNGQHEAAGVVHIQSAIRNPQSQIRPPPTPNTPPPAPPKMGLYSRYLLPILIDRAMSHLAAAAQRPTVLARAEGRVLELGFGTGLNLPHYPPAVRSVTAVDPNPGVARLARPRIAASAIPVQYVPLRDERRIGAPDASFDTVVCTWTLCSVADPAATLAEVHRLLRPGGRLLFIEHGLSPAPHLARWQRRFTPIQRRLAGGCHLDRDMSALLSASPLTIETCETFYLEGTPKLLGYTYRGSAMK